MSELILVELPVGERDIKGLLKCSQCAHLYKRPSSLTHSTFTQVPFVCEDCRCKDCGIVLNIECECGERHAVPSKEDSKVCTECIIIRQRVAALDPELLNIRKYDIANQDPVYGSFKRFHVELPEEGSFQ